MIIDVRATLAYRYPESNQTILRLQAARSADQRVLSESLDSGEARLREDAADGERLLRGWLPAGELRVTYTASVDNGSRPLLHAGAEQQSWASLPLDVHPYLLPSRYCPSDKFLRFAAREFGTLRGGAAVLSILDWMHAHVDYVAGVSDSESTAEHTFVDRAGVCRDFAHLAITLVRAAGIPARIVAAYADKLDPPDFHAVVEVWLSGSWWLVDPTRLAQVEGLVRIASGRDAADIAFLTTSGPVELIEMSVTAQAQNARAAA